MIKDEDIPIMFSLLKKSFKFLRLHNIAGKYKLVSNKKYGEFEKIKLSEEEWKWLEEDRLGVRNGET